MSQLTLYLDDTTRQMVVEAAASEGVSQSRWVAQLIRDKVQPSWPVGWRDALGSFPDFPLGTRPARCRRSSTGWVLAMVFMLDANTVSYAMRGEAAVVTMLTSLTPADVAVPFVT